MKKLLLIFSIIVLVVFGFYFWKGDMDLQSSFLAGNQSYHDSAPRDLETAFVTPSGFTLNKSFKHRSPDYIFETQLLSEKDKYAYGVQLVGFPEKDLNGKRQAPVKYYLGNADTRMRAEVVQYGGNDLIVQYLYHGLVPEFRPMINIFWSTEFGYVQVWQNVAGSIRTTPAFIQSKNWVTIHNDLLLLANEYLKKYPPLPATKYADFGPEAAKIMKNIDLNKLPQLTKKQDI